MPDLITIHHGRRSHRSCKKKCYDATSEHCLCICGGINHGVGLEQAVLNTARLYLVPALLNDNLHT